MFKIALVQNLSELRNYSYADLRADLCAMGFDVLSFTRENIATLASKLDGGVDCVLFASNSLNDQSIYEYVRTAEFSECFSRYLDRGGASLVLHQNALGNIPNPLPFIDEGIERLEKNYASENVTLKKNGRFFEQYYVFPNKVEISDITECCFKNTAVSGNYWLLMRASKEEWMPVLSDCYSNGVIYVNTKRKIIFSSVLLDYQKHLAFLENMLVNLMVDNMSLAILESEEPDSLGFSYFLSSLENNKLYYKKYTPRPDTIAELCSNIELGIHSAILVDERTKRELGDEIHDIISKYGVKLIEINEQTGARADSFVVHSTDKSVSLLFSKVELRIQKELSEGFVSGSFMKTAEVLSRLCEFEATGLTKAEYTKESISHVLEAMSAHITEDGSYDRTYGATCKALWIFYKFLGASDRLTRASRAYVKNNLTDDSLREMLEGHYVLSLFEDDRADYLKKSCAQVIFELASGGFARVTEYDFLSVLKLAVLCSDEMTLMRLFGFIKSNTDARGRFFNSYVTANTISYMIDMYERCESIENKEMIRELLFDMVSYLSNISTERMATEELLCTVCALYKFESVVSFPVSDLTELIFKCGTFPHDYHVFEKQINTYQSSRLEHDEMVRESARIKSEIGQLRIYKKGFYAVLTLFIVAIYLMIYLLTIVGEGGDSVFEILFSRIAESWPSVFAILIVPVISFVFNRYIKKKGEDDK